MQDWENYAHRCRVVLFSWGDLFYRVDYIVVSRRLPILRVDEFVVHGIFFTKNSFFAGIPFPNINSDIEKIHMPGEMIEHGVFSAFLNLVQEDEEFCKFFVHIRGVLNDGF